MLVGAHLCGIPVIKVSIDPADGADSWIDVAERSLSTEWKSTNSGSQCA
jgi:hypothetical protein